MAKAKKTTVKGKGTKKTTKQSVKGSEDEEDDEVALENVISESNETLPTEKEVIEVKEEKKAEALMPEKENIPIIEKIKEPEAIKQEKIIVSSEKKENEPAVHKSSEAPIISNPEIKSESEVIKAIESEPKVENILPQTPVAASSEEVVNRESIIKMLKEMEIDVEGLSEVELNALIEEYKEMSDFQQEDLSEIEKNIEEVKEESEIDKLARELEGEPEEVEFNPEIDDELERKIQEELEKKKQAKPKKIMTEEKFVEYLKERRTKIIYFALWEMVFNIDDHSTTKQGLYEVLKEVTSMDPIDPINEHKFYFGLGYILRLKLYEAPVVVFKSGKLKININIDNLKTILQGVGEPISMRPVITKEAKKKMFTDFFSDDFSDI